MYYKISILLQSMVCIWLELQIEMTNIIMSLYISFLGPRLLIFFYLFFYLQKHDKRKEISSFVVLEIHVAPQPDSTNDDTKQQYRIFCHSSENKVRYMEYSTL